MPWNVGECEHKILNSKGSFTWTYWAQVKVLKSWVKNSKCAPLVSMTTDEVDLRQWASNLSRHWSPLEGLLKYRLPPFSMNGMWSAQMAVPPAWHSSAWTIPQPANTPVPAIIHSHTFFSPWNLPLPWSGGQVDTRKTRGYAVSQPQYAAQLLWNHSSGYSSDVCVKKAALAPADASAEDLVLLVRGSSQSQKDGAKIHLTLRQWAYGLPCHEHHVYFINLGFCPTDYKPINVHYRKSW